MTKSILLKTFSTTLAILLTVSIATVVTPTAKVQAAGLTATTTTLTVDTNPSVYLEPLNFKATISPTPDGGSVQFLDNGVDLGGAIAVGGSAPVYYNTAMLAVGSHSITAVYSGDTNFATSTSNVITQTVNAGNPPTINAGTPNINGLCVSINGTVTANNPGSYIRWVNIDWGDGQTIFGWFPQTHTYGQTGNYTITVNAMDSIGQVSWTYIPVSVSGTVTQTKTLVTSSCNPSIGGQSVTFTAQISPIPDGGTVLFQVSGIANLNPTPVDSNGQAIYTDPHLFLGGFPNNVQAYYSGDNNFASSIGSMSQVVNPSATPIVNMWISNINGLCASFNGVITQMAPGLEITEMSWNWGDGQTTNGWFPITHTYAETGTYNVVVTSTDSKGQTQTLPIGVGITSTTTQTTTTVGANYNPSYSGGPVTFTANVSPIPPSGMVQFEVDGTNVGAVTVDSNGQATYTTSTLSIGNHTVTASYGGYNNIFSSSSGNLAQVVNTQETPTIQIWINGNINGLTVPMNGVTLPNATVPGAVITGVVWNWGDGQTMPGWMLQTHNYSQAGTYTITATATDNYGQSQSASIQVQVTGTAIPTVNTPLFAGATAVSGMAQANAIILLTVNSGTSYSTTADSNGVWNILDISPSLLTGDSISVTATAQKTATEPAQSISLAATEKVMPALNPIANLTNLTLSAGITGGSLSPTFDPGTYSYTESVTSMGVSVMPTWTQSNATVTVNGKAVTSGGYSSVNLVIGPNTITVMITMSTGTEIYSIIVTRSTGPLVSLLVTPGPTSNIQAGGTEQFAVNGSYQDGSTVNLTTSAVWASDTPTVATISPVGFATVVSTGTAYISASFSGISSPAVGLIVGTPSPSSPTSSITTRTQVLASGNGVNVGLKSDGTVVATGTNTSGQCNVSSWTDITQVSAGTGFTVGLKSDGTVVATGDNNFGECDVASWRNIIQVAAAEYYVVGLESNGTVVAAGRNNVGQCNVSSWTGIVQLTAFASFTVGLKYDGTVVATGLNSYGQCNVSNWTGITQVAAAGLFTIGLKSDGTVVATGNNISGQCNVGSWIGITQVAAGNGGTVGLESNGSVVYTGVPSFNQVTSWTNIIQLEAGWASYLGLESNGTVAAVGDDTYQETTSANSWNLGCATVTTVQKEAEISVTQNDGVAVSLTPNSNAIVTIGSINNGTTSPSGAGTISLNGSQYYDVLVTSNSDLGGAVATITISNSSVTADSTIQYWYNNQWNTATNIVINISSSPPTISGDVLVAYLTGTSFAIGVPTLNSIAVTPNPSTNLAVGSTEQFTATGTYSDGSTKDITSKVTWASSYYTKANISASGGLATGATVGTTNITAALNGITSQAVTLTVIPSATKTLGSSSSATYSTSSQTVNLAATVTATGASVNEGTVTFTIQNGSTVIGSPVTSATVSGGNANATYNILPGSTPVGSYTILATYNPGPDFNGSSDNRATLVVNKANTSTTGVNATANYSSNGEVANLTAFVSSLAGVVNEGTVTFTIRKGAMTVGTAVTAAVNGGNANTAYTLPAGTAVGTYNIVVAYSGGPDFNISNNTASVVVKKADQIFVVSFPNPSVSGSQVVFAALVVPSSLNPASLITFVNGQAVLNTNALATINSGNLPTGSATFYNGTSSLGTVTLNKFGFATLTTSSLPVGSDSITAQYLGDPNYFASTSTVINQVVKNKTSTALTSSLQTSVFGQAVSLTAVVTPNSATGIITFSDGSKSLGTATLSGGAASLSVSSLAIGSHNLTAIYIGDAVNAGVTSNTVSETVNKANTTTNLISSLNPAKSGNIVTFTVAVNVAAPGAGNPTGTVTFKDSTTGKTLGTTIVNNSGQATCSTSSLSVATHSVLASYNGDNNFNGSTSNTVSQVITK